MSLQQAGTPKIITTFDGSKTVRFKGTQVSYHSVYGAVQESEHIFIGSGLQPLFEKQDHVAVLEVGFGTGLNALLTTMEAFELRKSVDYTALEPYPLSADMYANLEYADYLDKPFLNRQYLNMHEVDPGKTQKMGSHFTFTRHNTGILEFETEQTFDCIFFDAFEPKAAPEMWTPEVLEKCFQFLRPGGLLVTYCSKGEVVRHLRNIGFSVEKLPGPLGKREITRAAKHEHE